MSTPPFKPRRATLAFATLGAVTLAGLAPVAAVAALVDTAAQWPLMVTEIVPDTTSYDDFEFFEVTNTTDADIDLDAAGYGLQYFGATNPVNLTIPAGTVIPAGGSTVFWVTYSTDTVTAPDRTEAEFRAAFPEGAADYSIVRATGQAGMANGGNRGVRVVKDAGATVVAQSYYTATDVSVHLGATFGVPSAGTGADLEVRGKQVAPTPGAIDAALLQPVELPPIEVEGWPVMVSEIMANNSGTDYYEYVEVANTSPEEITLGGDGYQLTYMYANSADRAGDKPLTLAEPVTIPAGGVAVVWIQNSTYTDPSGTYAPDSGLPKTIADFRAFYDLGDHVIVATATGQNGVDNGGNRGFRVVDAQDEIVSWSFYGAADVGNHKVAELGLPLEEDTLAMRVNRAQAEPSPGVLVRPLDKVTDPELATSLLQITELLPDSDNVGTGDGYEYIEVYNPTDEHLAWDDFTLRYLYPLADLSTSSSVLWPTQQRGITINPGQTLTLWVKNGQNDALTDADFNAKFGTDLEMGVDLAEIFTGGMANGSLRGLQIETNTGVAINRAYYNVDGADDTQPNRGIQYAVAADGADEVQVLTGTDVASPGAVAAAQVHAALAQAPAAGEAPVIVDLTPTVFTPGEPFAIEATITDDVLVRTVTVRLSSDVESETVDLNLTADEHGVFRTELLAVDTVGKGSYTYEILASDGSTEVSSGERTVSSTVTTAPLRMGLEPGAILSGVSAISAAADKHPATLTLAVDGTEVEGYAELEREPVFAFEATATDMYFQNGVVMDGEVLTIFDQGLYGNVGTITAPIALDKVNPGESFSVRIYAGTKKAPEIDLNENNDNFNVQNLRLLLPDGRTLRPSEIADPTKWISMGDSGGAVDYVEATFTAPDDAFTALAHDWDTTTVADGTHTISAADGEATASVDVTVDNTAPVVELSIEDGAVMHGDFTVDADVQDPGSGVASVSATLDGFRTYLPLEMSSLEGEPGDHTLVVTAIDEAGNTTVAEAGFTIPEEEPVISGLLPGDDAVVSGVVDLAATVTDPTGDTLDVEFASGTAVTAGAGLEVSLGSASDAAATSRVDARPASSAEVEGIATLDGQSTLVASDAKLPYLLLEASVPEGAPADAEMRVRWDGSANADAKVILSVLDPAAGEWVEIDRHITAADGEDFSLEGLVALADYAVDGTVTALVQHSEGWAGDDLSSRDSEVEPHHADDTPREDYDFTIAWESDTQYYNAYEDIYDRQTSIHDYLLAEREDLNLQYLMHTGDIVNTSTIEDEWVRADAAYAPLDEAGLPYGVLAGNHDVNQLTNDYSDYSQWFGAARYQDNPWYGGQLQDNRGHYDLITAGGIDFLMLYMGWAPGDQQIDWMNEVLAQYPERVAFVNLHEYMLTTGGLGAIPQRIFDEVVAPNPNVRFVSSGHYHDAYTRLDSFDDDGDGQDDRTVTSMLFDYQGLPNGGEGYLRLLHFDTEGERIIVRTYSDYLQDYNSDDPSLEMEHQEFEIPFAQAGIEVTTKALVTDAVRADVLSSDSIATFADVASGSTVTTSWAPGAGEHQWYVRATDEHGAQSVSDVRTVTVTVPTLTDIATNPFRAEIEWLASTGITTGWSTGEGVAEFRPLQNVNRDMMAAFLYRLAGSPEFEPEGQTFADVTPETDFYKEIEWLATTGVTEGWTVGDRVEFRPRTAVNRDVMAAFLYRFAGSPEFEAPSRSPFIDVATDHVFYDEIAWLASTGISEGWPVAGGAEFRTTTPVKRDVMAAFLSRFAAMSPA